MERLRGIALKEERYYPYVNIGGKLVRIFENSDGYRGQVVCTFFRVKAVVMDMDGKFYDRISIHTRFGKTLF